MDEFDKEFDAAPEFDAEFDAAPDAEAVEQSPSFLKQLYQDTVEPLVQPIADLGTGVARGMSANSLDELGGALGAGVESGLGAIGIGPAAADAQLAAQGFQGAEESFLDKYRGYQQGVEQEMKEAEERSPVLSIGGEIAGGITTGKILSGLGAFGKVEKLKSIGDVARDSGKAKAAMELLTRGGKAYAGMAPAIAAESALTSEKQLLGPQSDISGVAKDVGTGLAFGLPAVMGLTAATDLMAPAAGKKAEKYIQKAKDVFQDENNPRLRQVAKAFEYGTEGMAHPRSQAADIKSGADAFALRDEKAITTVLGTLEAADSKLGQEVGDSLKKATDRGLTMDITPEIDSAFAKLDEISQSIPSFASSRKSAAAYEKLANSAATGQALNPSDVKTIIDDIDASIGIFKSATNKGPAEAATLNELINLRKSISQTLKKNVPEYRLAAERFENFRNVLEQLVSRDKPADITNKFYGQLRDPENKLYGSLQDMIENVQRNDAATQPSRTSFVKFMNSLEDFQAKDAARIAADGTKTKVLPDVTQLRKQILDASDDSVLRGSARATTQSRSVVPDVKEAIIGKAPTTGAYYAGRIVREAPNTKVAKLAKNLYKMPDNMALNLASKLEDSPSFKNVGVALREAIETGNTSKKQAAIFTIMQNPNAKLYINEDELNEEEQGM